MPLFLNTHLFVFSAFVGLFLVGVLFGGGVDLLLAAQWLHLVAACATSLSQVAASLQGWPFPRLYPLLHIHNHAVKLLLRLPKAPPLASSQLHCGKLASYFPLQFLTWPLHC